MVNYERLDLHVTSTMVTHADPVCMRDKWTQSSHVPGLRIAQVNLKSKVDAWERSFEKQSAKPDPELETTPPVPVSPMVLT